MVVGNAPPERAGAASAISETGLEFGGALGIAVLGTLGMAIYRSSVAANMPVGISPEVAHAAQETLGGAVAAAAQLPDSGAALLNVAHVAFVQALHLLAGIGFVAFVLLAVMTAILLRDVPHHAGEAHSETVDEPHPLPQAEGSTAG
jgi:DHA2 family multidrug resistance protein-like MFS transporter